MTGPLSSGLPRDLLAAVFDASTVVTIGTNSHKPGTGIARTFRTQDAPGGTIPDAVVVARLRAIADAIERGEL
ncbi:hypothetical protein ACWDYH_15010 [Nocardia goodfellowii]